MLKVLQIEADIYEYDYNQEKESLIEYACRQANAWLPAKAKIVKVDYKPNRFNDIETGIILTVFYTVPEEDVIRPL